MSVSPFLAVPPKERPTLGRPPWSLRSLQLGAADGSGGHDVMMAGQTTSLEWLFEWDFIAISCHFIGFKGDFIVHSDSIGIYLISLISLIS